LIARVGDEVDEEWVPGIAVAVVVDGEIRDAGAVGVTQYAGGMAATADTVFRWNSISKMHTATAVMQQVELGTMDLDAPITDHVPELVLSGGYDPADITLRHLMTHTAALPDWYDAQCSDSLADHWDRTSPYPWAPSGSFYNYSNDGWSLAGRALENLLGLDFRTIQAENVLGPTGMETGTFDAAWAMDNAPYAIGWDGWRYYTPEDWECGFNDPAAGLWGSVSDLAKTALVHLDDGGELLSPDSVAAMRSQQTTWYPGDATVGLGQFTYQHRGVDYVSHGGSGAGYRTSLAIVPSQDFGIVVAANASWAEVSELVTDAFDIYLDLPDDWEPDRYDTDPATWTEYEGVYEDPLYYGTMIVTLDELEQLYVRFADLGNDSYRLYQYGSDAFFFVSNDSWYTMRFIPDDTGEVRWFVNRYFVGEKNAGGPAGPAPTATDEERLTIWNLAALSEEPGPVFMED
jgi:CubicO group peptidase (beta-lactamase class C family)